MADRVGEQLGHYRLLKRLGSGGFAEVYEGEHIHLRTHAAVKVLFERLAQQNKQGFVDEAQTIANLIHPHIVRLFDFGIEDNTPYMVMDYAPHGTLRDQYPPGSQLPLPLIISYVKQVAEALHYAHNKKVIHRDVKPENMLLGSNNDLWLSDFGIAVIAHSSRSQITQDVAGSWQYTAPEQFKGKPQPASDQYALGIVVYEWLCGFPPFHGSLAQLYDQHLSVSPPPLHTRGLNIPPKIEQVIMRALAKDPQQRFDSIQAFAQALKDTVEQAVLQRQERLFLGTGISTRERQELADVPTEPNAGRQLFEGVGIVQQKRESRVGERVIRFDNMILEPSGFEKLDIFEGFSPDGKLIMLRQNGQHVLYNLIEKRKKILPISEPNISLSDIQKYVLIYSNWGNPSSIYDMQTGKLILKTFAEYNMFITDRYFAWVNYNKDAYMNINHTSPYSYSLYDLQGKNFIHKNHDFGPFKVFNSFSPNGTYVSVYDYDGFAEIYNIFSGKAIFKCEGTKNYGSWHYWLSDDIYLVYGALSAFVYNISTGVAIREIKNIQATKRSKYRILSISPDKQYAVVIRPEVEEGPSDHMYLVNLMNMRTGNIVHEMQSIPFSVSQWSPSGEYVVIRTTGAMASELYLYSIRLKKIELKKAIYIASINTNLDLFSNGNLIQYARGEVGKPLELVQIYEE